MIAALAHALPGGGREARRHAVRDGGDHPRRNVRRQRRSAAVPRSGPPGGQRAPRGTSSRTRLPSRRPKAVRLRALLDRASGWRCSRRRSTSRPRATPGSRSCTTSTTRGAGSPRVDPDGGAPSSGQRTRGGAGGLDEPPCGRARGEITLPRRARSRALARGRGVLPGGGPTCVRPRTREVAAVLRAHGAVLAIGAQSSLTGGATPAGVRSSRWSTSIRGDRRDGAAGSVRRRRRSREAPRRGASAPALLRRRRRSTARRSAGWRLNARRRDVQARDDAALGRN